MKNTKYPGFSILLNFSGDMSFKFKKEPYTLRIKIPFISVVLVTKNLEAMYEAYASTLINKIESLENGS